MSKLKDFNWIARTGNFDKLSYGDPNENLYILDTGVVIDLENDFHANRTQYRINLDNNYVKRDQHELSPGEMLDRIFMISPILITPGVFDEMRNHKNCRIGNRNEISDATFCLLKRHYEDSKHLFMEYSLNGKRPFFVYERELKLTGTNFVNLYDKLGFDPSKDEIRLNTWLASKEGFSGDSRKGLKELVSDVDLEVINTSVILADELRNYQSPIKWINVLSSDEHVLGTIHYLKKADRFKDLPIRCMDTRNDLRSFIQEHD